MENINKLISLGYEKLIGQGTVEACDHWLEAFELIKEVAREKSYKNIKQIEEEFKFVEHLTNWVQDIEMELENAGIEEKEYFKKRITYTTEFCDIFTETDQFIIMSMKLAKAESYFELEEVTKSEELFKQYAEEYKDSVWPFVKWGDVYWLSNILNERRELLNVDKAMEIYKSGLGRDAHEDYILEDRIGDLQEIIDRQ